MTTAEALQHLFPYPGDSRLAKSLEITAPKVGDVYEPLEPFTQMARVNGPWELLAVMRGEWKLVSQHGATFVLQLQDGTDDFGHGGTYLQMSRYEIESKMRRVEA